MLSLKGDLVTRHGQLPHPAASSMASSSDKATGNVAASPSPSRNGATPQHQPQSKNNTIGVYFCFVMMIISIVLWKFVIIKHLHISEDHSIKSDGNTNSKGLHHPKGRRSTLHHSELGEHSLENTEYVEHLLDETSFLLREVMLIKSNNDTIKKEGYNDNNNIDAGGVGASSHKAVLELHSELLTLQQSSSKVEHSLSMCEEDRMHTNERLDNCKTSLAELQNLVNTTVPTPTPSCDCISASSSTSIRTSAGAVIECAGHGRKWLVVGMPTVSRLHTEDYLLKSLTAIAEQLPTDPLDILYHKILVVVVNVQGVGHSRFEEAKHLFNKHHPKSAYFEFLTADDADYLPDVVSGATPANDVGTPNKPGYRVRKQTRNLVTTMRKSFDKGDFYLFLEDDMKLCANAMNIMQYLLAKAGRYHPNWLAIRASYGMNGVFMRNADMKVFAEYILKHQARRPPDHLVVEWYAGESKESGKYRGQRSNIGFRYNLFDHLGAVSTLRSQTSTSYPKCYDELLEPTVFKVEAFSKQQCPDDDIWPCNVQHAEKHRLKIV